MKGILSAIVFAPLVGSFLILLVKKENAKLMKQIGVAATLISLALSTYVVINFKPNGGIQFVDRLMWSKTIGASYYLGVDGLGLPMLFLASLLTLLALVASWNISVKPKGYFALLLLLEVGMLGVFVALDYVLFYIFWELVLLPMYFLIGIWGGERREYAAIKFFIYTLAGSVFMLLGILALYFKGGANTFDMVVLAKHGYPVAFQYVVFWGFFLGFAVKVPIFPFHTWLPDAHVEAPTAVSVLLAGILLKMGAYGFIRVMLPTLPAASRKFALVLVILGVINIIYGALNAMIQSDLKKMVAYSSVSHMGYVMLGIGALTAMGLNGAMMQMFSHGCITAMLFLIVGYIYERTHTRQIPELGGLLNKIPVLGAILCFASFASLGLPGLSGFVAEFLVLIGAMTPKLVVHYGSTWSVISSYLGSIKVWAMVGSTGVVITAAYLLWMLQRVVMGVYPERLGDLADASPREIFTFVPLMALILAVGIYPESLLRFINSTANAIVKTVT